MDNLYATKMTIERRIMYDVLNPIPPLSLPAFNKSFKKSHTFEERYAESTRIKKHYPERIPIICERSSSSPNMPIIDKSKYLVPIDLTTGQFIYVIRKRLRLPAEKSLIFFINGSIPSSNVPFKTLYDKNKDADGFLYVQYGSENTFGFNRI